MTEITRREGLRRAGAAGLGAGALAGAADLGVGRGADAAPAPAGGAAKARTITCLGDSISDVQTLGQDAYPTWLARYLAPIRVSFDGISGNDAEAILARCRPDGIHTRAQVRRPGSITYVLVGIIDIIFDPHTNANELTGDVSRIYRYLAGFKSTVYPITILPFGRSRYFTPERERLRVAVNNWILRHPHAVNAELTMSDGGRPPKLRPEFDGGDGLHPLNVIGPQMLALTCAVALVPR